MDIIKLIKQVYRRKIWIAWLKVLLIFAGILGWSILISLALVPLHKWLALTVFFLIFLSSFVIFIWQGHFSFPTIVESCSAIDKYYGSKDRVLTFYESFSNKKDLAQQEVIKQQLSSLITKFDPKEIEPLILSRWFKGFIVSIALVWFASIFIYLQLRKDLSPYALKEADSVKTIIKNNELLPPSVKETLKDLVDILESHSLTDIEVQNALQNAQLEIEQSLKDIESDSGESREVAGAESRSQEKNKEKEPEKKEEQREEKPKEEKTEEKKEQQDSKSSNKEDQKEKGEGQNSQNQNSQKDKEQGNKEGKDGKEGQKSDQQSGGDGQGEGKGKQGEGTQGGKEQGKAGQGSSKEESSEQKEGQGGKPQKDQGGGSGDSEKEQALKEAQQSLSELEQKRDQKANKEKGGSSDGANKDPEGKKQESGKENKADQNSGNNEGEKEGDKEQKKPDQQGKGNDNQGKKDEQKQDQDQSGKEKQSGQEGTKDQDAEKNKNEEGKNPGDAKQPSTNEPKDQQRSPFGENKSGKDSKSPELPSMPVLSEDAKRFDESEDGKDGRGGGDKTFKDLRVGAENEKLNSEFVGADSKLSANKNKAGYKTDLRAVELAQPDSNQSKGRQEIPLEYKDVIN